MSQTGKSENQRIAEIFRLRAKTFSPFRRIFEEEFLRRFGKPLGTTKNHLPAQDTLIGAYLAHPEWFIVKEMPLRYKGIVDGSEKRKDRVKIITSLTPEGKENFRPWLWSAIKANFF